MKTIRSQYKDYHSHDSLAHTHYYALLGLITITLFSGLILTSSITSATDDSIVDEVNITVPVSCTLSGTGMNSHNAEIPNGTYQADIGTTTLKAFCNDNAGFAIYAAGYTGNEIGGTNSNKLVGTNASSNATIDTGTATSAGNPDISNWAMKLTTVSSPTPTYPITLDNGFGSYSAVPNSYTKVAHRDSSTDIGTNAEGATLTTTYAAYISKTQAADTYSGQVIYTLVHPVSEEPLQPQQATAGCINYFANASTAVGTMGCQSASDGQTKTLLASNFSRTGYGFAGWSDKYDYATNSSAKFYGPQEDITVPTGTTANGLSLYAVWVKSEGSLQDSSKVSQLCGTGTGALTTAPTDGTANLTSVTALTDERDNQTYAIARLADGNCWMIENLRLEAEHTRSAEDQALAQGYGTSATYGNFGGLADAESSNFDNVTTANSLYYNGIQEGSASIDIGTGVFNYPGYRIPRYNNWNNQSTSSNRPQNPTTNSATYSTTNAGMYSYGNYYTWHAAMANTTHYNSPTATDTDGKTSETVNTSLCPTGWRLPYGRDTGNGALSGGFYNLNYKINNDSNITDSTAIRKAKSFPNNFLYSGYFVTSSAYGRGNNGWYWSSTAYHNSYGYSMTLSGGGLDPGGNGADKHDGQSIRCIAAS